MKLPSTPAKLPRLVAASILAALALGFSALSVATDTGDALHGAVSFGDVNVASPPDVPTLYGRKAAAPGRVCPFYDTDADPLLLRHESRHEVCVDDAIARAVRRVGTHQPFASYDAMNHGHR